jgi:NAD(P)-dependent dehydrogenase (short-subunit alcohol dehydrogenase family)
MVLFSNNIISMNKKIAIVTGGNRGLGKEMAISLAKKSFDVIITYNNNEVQANEVVTVLKNEYNVQASSLQLDLSKMESIAPFVINLKNHLTSIFKSDGFDFLINNAGMGKTVPFAEMTESIFDEFMNVHFKGVYFLTQKLLSLMNDHGSIINISSGTTRWSNPGYSVYASMKGGVEVLTKYLAKELGHRGIRANVVAPGPVETDFNNAAIRNNPQLKTVLSNMSPLGRVGAADDLGGVVAFLCSEDAKWINGQRIEVSGGLNV